MSSESELIATSVSNLLGHISSIQEEFGPDNSFWFRGHSCGETWELVPHVHRKSLKYNEQQLLLQFQLKAPSRYNKCPPNEDQASWTSLAQHYGLPTRLLDWTSSPLIAAYFSTLKTEEKESAKIWMLDPGKMNSIITGKEPCVYTFRAEECNHMITAGWHNNGREEFEYLASVPDEIDLRLILQQSSFTIHKDENPLDNHKNANDFLRKITIPYEAKENIRKELNLLGFRQSTLFPDLENLATCLKNDH